MAARVPARPAAGAGRALCPAATRGDTGIPRGGAPRITAGRCGRNGAGVALGDEQGPARHPPGCGHPPEHVRIDLVAQRQQAAERGLQCSEHDAAERPVSHQYRASAGGRVASSRGSSGMTGSTEGSISRRGLRSATWRQRSPTRARSRGADATNVRCRIAPSMRRTTLCAITAEDDHSRSRTVARLTCRPRRRPRATSRSPTKKVATPTPRPAAAAHTQP
jgi:hypothetical protein